MADSVVRIAEVTHPYQVGDVVNWRGKLFTVTDLFWDGIGPKITVNDETGVPSTIYASVVMPASAVDLLGRIE